MFNSSGEWLRENFTGLRGFRFSMELVDSTILGAHSTSSSGKLIFSTGGTGWTASAWYASTFGITAQSSSRVLTPGGFCISFCSRRSASCLIFSSHCVVRWLMSNDFWRRFSNRSEWSLLTLSVSLPFCDDSPRMGRDWAWNSKCWIEFEM